MSAIGKRSLFTFFSGRAYVFGFLATQKKNTFCLFQFSIKLICNAKHTVKTQKQWRKKRLQIRHIIFAGDIFQRAHTYTHTNTTQRNRTLNPWQRCKICFTLKVGSHNSYNAISSQPKLKKQASSVCAFVYLFVLKILVGLFSQILPCRWLQFPFPNNAREWARENNKYFEIA